MRAAIQLPTLERLRVHGYALYPGPRQQGIDLTFPAGVTVLAGINGIGKTTLLQLLLRMILGPLNPSKAASRDPGRVSDRKLVSASSFPYFASRVPPPLSDEAVATLDFRIGTRAFVVRRAMGSMALREVTIDGKRRRDLTDHGLLDAMAAVAGIGSGYDFYMVVRYLQFFTEERLPVLWSSSTQFEVFKMLFVDPSVATELSALYTEVQRVDSNYRNRKNQLTLRKDAQDVLAALRPTSDTVTPQQVADKAAELNTARVAAQKAREVLEKLAAQRDAARHAVATQEYAVDDYRRALAQSDAAYISHALPGLEDKLQFLMQGLGSGVGCFVCGTPGRKQHHAISKTLRSGHCFVCHSKLPAGRANVASIKVADVRKDETALAEAVAILNAREATLAQREQAVVDQQGRLRQVLTQVQQRSEEHLFLAAQVPDPVASPLQDEITREELELEQLDTKRKALTENYRSAVGRAQTSIEAIREALAERIAAYAERFLQESVSVRFERNSPFSLATGVSKVNIPTFRVAMTSGTHATQQVRTSETSVSESQKEFLDLAFRLAVLDMVTHDGAMTLVVETPEASLDTWFMQRAADLMRDFASRGSSGQRRVIATSNLNGTSMIGHLLGRPAGSRRKPSGHLINLMELTAQPGVLKDKTAQALFEHEVGQYTDA
ncbi:MAG: hypothetical protein BGP24_09630 [Lysobacterales bacterium 69-70]|nr:MAG: hypothetical protein ABS97_12655 [Xanthomonadaceae bacterium SCN 69-320]ODV20624.1 MAG: hypothetical protein ABT27_07015 [Xanthomonadaceae bacterium SCN 69-25]OJZ01017.1 MAG: hypothetical protein BGP24_09630 [Xanthomonadales bacterium 69-70]